MSIVAERDPETRAEESPPPSAWGTGLGYPDWFERIGPSAHSMFNAFNRYGAVPALRMGLGRYMSTPFTGYMLLLRTRGRTSRQMREAPLGYAIQGEYIYCMAGFGRQTHWFRNILAEPRVEVVLPDRAISGLAEEVVDPDERAAVLPPLTRGMAPAVLATGLGNPWRQSDEQIVAAMAAFPLVRIRQTGLAAGPNDPGGLGWVVLSATATLATLYILSNAKRLLRRRSRRNAGC